MEQVPPDNEDSIGTPATNGTSATSKLVEESKITQESVLDDVVKAREKEIHDKIGDFSYKIDARSENSNGLRVGMLRFGDDRNKTGKFGKESMIIVLFNLAAQVLF